MQESQEFESTGRPGVPARLSSHDDALHQGLTAPLIEELFGADSYARLTATLRNELGTSGPLQEALVGRISHHLAALELSRQAELAALREGARQTVTLKSAEAGLATDATDAELSMAVSSEILGRITSYGRSHERGLLAALAKLQKLKHPRAPAVLRSQADLNQCGGDRKVPPAAAHEGSEAEQLEANPFGDDAVCEAYLERRIRGADYRCPRCGAARGYWLDQRRRWECRHCRKQAGARTGTVMAGSPLRLSVWFKAIKIVVTQRDSSIAEVAADLRVGRLPTIRALLRKIHSALASPDRNRLLAGLDHVFLTPEPETAVPETSVSGEIFPQIEK